jgi:hypothetical protein
MRSVKSGVLGCVAIVAFACLGGLVTSAHGVTYVSKCALATTAKAKRACNAFPCNCSSSEAGVACDANFPKACLQSSSCGCGYINAGTCVFHASGENGVWCDGPSGRTLNCRK